MSGMVKDKRIEINVGSEKNEGSKKNGITENNKKRKADGSIKGNKKTDNNEAINKKAWHRECAYAYFWESIPGIGEKTIQKLYKQFGSYEKMYQASLDGFFKEGIRAAFIKQKEDWNIIEEYKRLRDNKIWCIPIKLPGYPDKLKELSSPPAALFVKGRLPEGGRPAVAVVGARECSPYGRMAAKELGKAMAQSGIQVISGMARGIDGISQQAAVENGGISFGVLGCGVDVCYPAENRSIYDALTNGKNQGGVISEFMPKTGPAGIHFPMRNRIISGLADILVVVEAKEKSGTFITVSNALEQGKDVYAIPGRLNDPLSYGCSRLIYEGASIIYDLDRFVEEVFERTSYTRVCNGENTFLKEMLTNYECGKINQEAESKGLESQILKILDIQYLSVGNILCMMEGHPVNEVLAALSTLECSGKVESEGSFYRKTTCPP